MRWILIALLAVHGLVHLVGVATSFGYVALPQLAQPISRPWGVAWKYARYAKVAVRNGAGSGAHLTRPVGLTAEFVPSTDPTLIRPGGSLTVQLLTNGKPVAGAAISAVNDEKAIKGQTDDQGRVTFTLDRPGAWLVKTVHMVRLPQPAAEADWESYWVTLAFGTAP